MKNENLDKGKRILIHFRIDLGILVLRKVKFKEKKVSKYGEKNELCFLS